MSSRSEISVVRKQDSWVGCFELMASRCEVHIRDDSCDLAGELFEKAYEEALRIERKLSRYIPGNIIASINSSELVAVEVDMEIQSLLNYSDSLFKISNGMFDITSGILRHIWPFEKDAREKGHFSEPSRTDVQMVLNKVGWQKVYWSSPYIRLKRGMEIDLGGLGKEYAVDKVYQLIETLFEGDFMVNFGGDCRCRGTKSTPWVVAIEQSDADVGVNPDVITLVAGGVATSGNTKRFIQLGNKRYGHILNPVSGYPVESAPLSVTVVQENCIAAGALSTLAMLQGAGAEQYLKDQNLLFWCYR